MMDFIRKIYKKYSQQIRNIKFFKIRKKIKGKKVSIISSDCLGGILYHDMGLEFDSPTINLFFKESDYSFLNFCLDIDYYLNKEIVVKDDINFPKGIIRGDDRHQDVNIGFMHYQTAIDAKESWDKRKKRIQKNRIIFYLKFELDKQDLFYINKIDNIFVITSQKTNPELINDKVHTSKYFSKLDKNDGKIMSFKGLFGRRNFDDLALMRYIDEQCDKGYEI